MLPLFFWHYKALQTKLQKGRDIYQQALNKQSLDFVVYSDPVPGDDILPKEAFGWINAMIHRLFLEKRFCPIFKMEMCSKVEKAVNNANLPKMIEKILVHAFELDDTCPQVSNIERILTQYDDETVNKHPLLWKYLLLLQVIYIVLWIPFEFQW